MSIEPLVFKILADADDRGVRAMDRSVGNLDISSRKASNTMRSFILELSQAQTGADLASAAMNAFSKILGTTLAGTAAVIAGKVIIDAFQKVSDNVNKAKDSLASAREEISKMGSVRGLAEGAAQANLLYRAASDAEKAIKEIEKSKLQNFIAEVRGAKTELAAMAEEARRAADSAKREGIEREAAQRNITQNLSKEQEAARKVAEQYNASIEAARELEKSARDRMAQEAKAGITGPTQATEDLRKALALQESLTQGQQKAAAKAEAAAKEELRKKENLEQNKLIIQDQESKDRSRKEAMDQFQREIDERNQQTARDSAEFYRRLEEQKKRDKEKSNLEKESADLRIKSLDLEERLVQQRKQIILAETRVAERTIAGTGTGRGLGQRPSSLEVGIQKRAEHTARQAEAQFRKDERRRIKDEMELEAGNVYSETGSRIRGRDISQFDVNRRLEEAVTKGQIEATRQQYDEARQARAGAQATEETLRAVRENLQKVLDELKTYASVT